MAKRSALLVGLLCLLLVNVACAKLPSRKIRPVDEGGSIRLLVVGADPYMDALITAFHGEYPTDRVVKSTLAVGPSTAGDIRYRIDQGQVDLLSLPEGSGQVLEQGGLLPLDPYLQKSRLDTAPFGSLLEQMRWGGVLYDLPYLIDPYLLLLNRERFAAAGGGAPGEGWDWEGFRTLAGRLTAGPEEVGLWGLAPVGREELLLTWLQQRVGEPFYRAGVREVQEVLQLAATLAQTDRSTPQRADEAEGAGVNHLLERRAGLVHATLSTHLTLGQGEGNPWAVLPQPLLRGAAPRGLTSYRSLGIAATSAQPAAAWEFLRFAAGPTGAEILAKGGGVPAYRSPVVEAALFTRQPPAPEALRSLLAGSFTIQPRVADSLDGRRAELIQAGIRQVLAGERTWESAAQEFEAKLRLLE